ncbi:MAG: hypothetical protein Q4P29_07105 [Tissierellia bacterium]|nr:hypothetical protein [Tissierellia bacterium]
MKTINEQDKQNMLEQILAKNERYIFKTWATVSIKARDLAMLRDISATDIGPATRVSNCYAYIGGTKESLNFIILDPIISTKIRNTLSIPLSKIDKAMVKRSLIIGKVSIELAIADSKIDIDLSDKSVGTDLLNQMEEIDKMIKYLDNK